MSVSEPPSLSTNHRFAVYCSESPAVSSYSGAGHHSFQLLQARLWLLATALCHHPLHTHILCSHTHTLTFGRMGGWCFEDPLSCRSINNCFKLSPCAPEWRTKMKNLSPYFAQVQSTNFKFFFLFFLILPWQSCMLVLLFLLTTQAGMLGLIDYEANRTRPTGCTSPALCVHLSGCIELEERIQLHPTAVC